MNDSAFGKLPESMESGRSLGVIEEVMSLEVLTSGVKSVSSAFSAVDLAAGPADWPLWFTIVYCGLIALGLELLSHIVHILFGFADDIPIRGKHLDKFAFQDHLFVNINKVLTMVFVYHVIWVTYNTPSIKWRQEELTLMNSLGALVGFYAFYDFFYMWFHRILHLRSIYVYIHKHHHQQKAPSRGNLDAINVNPIEFLVGEYLHLLTIYVIPCHIYAVAFFILAGGIFASLNHTRHDIVIPGLYDVKAHDIHHRIPESNYGQYTMFWDKLHGSWIPYKKEIAVNFDATKKK